MENDIYSKIDRPTLLLDVERAKSNIRRMVSKVREQNIRFRPHFKTHQSAEIGCWFRDAGVHQITVSSVEMAAYFINNGWKDITIAFPFNWRQVDEVNDLAMVSHLGLLVESIETAEFIGNNVIHPVDIWIKIDVGAHRTGIDWKDLDTIHSIAEEIIKHPNLSLRGLLTHAGHTYQVKNKSEIDGIYQGTFEHLKMIRDHFKGIYPLEISVGDTPACSVTKDLGDVDEMRPGNFVFYDAQQLSVGSCTEDNIATAVACPVVAKHRERREVVIYGGAIHLSKEYLSDNGHITYGLVAFPQGNGWGRCIPGAYVARLSQEHGIVRFEDDSFDQVKIGSLLIVIPIHICLVVSALRRYIALSGKEIQTMESCNTKGIS